MVALNFRHVHYNEALKTHTEIRDLLDNDTITIAYKFFDQMKAEVMMFFFYQYVLVSKSLNGLMFLIT